MDEKVLAQLTKISDVLNRKRVLMLSLGVGNYKLFPEKEMGEPSLTNDKKIKIIKEGELRPYEQTAYQFDRSEETHNEAFIAKPLTKEFDPQEIVIIGTSKSAWTAFYWAFGDGNTEHLLKLFEMEENGSKDVNKQEVKKQAETIEKIYREGIKDSAFQGKKIHIIVTRYGINREELQENYDLISDKMASIMGETGMKYEVAFDITHSFRSMPIYNLVILNYLQNVIKAELKISHVYYGNLEVKHENDNKASIVDLDELIHVLNLSNAVNEFKNTGNAKSLLDIIPDSEEGLKKTLMEFDWAMQINDFGQVTKSLKEMVWASCGNEDGSLNKYVDLKKMIMHVLKEKFFDGLEELTPEKVKKMSSADMQYRLAKWYHRQNRYGQALVTGLEALRSHLVPIYLAYKEKPVNKENEQNENNRIAAMKRLTNAAALFGQGKLRPDKGEEKAKDILCRLGKAAARVIPVRNMFAHNLDGSILPYTRKCTGQEKNSLKEQVDEFFTAFTDFVKAMQKDYDTMYQIYTKRASKNNRSKNEVIRLIIAPPDINDEEKIYRNYAKSARGKCYNVYTLDPKICRYLCSNKKSVENSALFLAEYMENLDIEPEHTHIILYKLAANQKINYMQALRGIGFSCIFDETKTTENLPQFAFKMDENKYEEMRMQWKNRMESHSHVMALMEKDIICKIKFEDGK